MFPSPLKGFNKGEIAQVQNLEHIQFLRATSLSHQVNGSAKKKKKNTQNKTKNKTKQTNNNNKKKTGEMALVQKLEHILFLTAPSLSHQVSGSAKKKSLWFVMLRWS